VTRRLRGPPAELAAGLEAGAVSITDSPPSAGVPQRARRRLSRRGRRVLGVLAGLALMAGGVVGFWQSAAAFDERFAVIVAARDLPAGHLLAVGDTEPALVLPGAVPHLAWSDDASQALEGFALAYPTQAGSLITAQMLAEPVTAPFGNRLEVHVPIDASLAPAGVFEGDLVLLVDPGAPSTAHSRGRARQVIDTLRIESLAGTALRLFAPPAEWVRWRTLPTRLGGPPMVLPVPLGGDAAELAAELDAVWADQHRQAAASGSLLGADWSSAARPGLLEAIVAVDATLSPSGIAQGDLALLVDPGVPLQEASGGRPRSVLRSVRLDHYRDGQLGIWAEPAEWVWWRSLPGRLGAAPMLLRVAPGTDVEQAAAELNEAWRAEWEQRR